MATATTATAPVVTVANPRRVRLTAALLTTADLARVIRTQGWATVAVAR